MRRLSIIVVLAALSFMLTLTPAQAAGWTATATPLDLRAGPGGTAAYLAPDGSRFAHLNRDEFCLYTLTGEKEQCVTLDRSVGIDAESVRWSPDSKKLAFTENFLITLRDSDVWVYDADANTLTDMTSDANRANISKMMGNTDPKLIFTIDLTPQWATDSQSIYFIRYSFSTTKDARPHFSKLNLSDGTVEEIATVESNRAFIAYGFALAPDESLIAYNHDSQGREKDGTFYLDLATHESRFGAAPIQKTAPWAYQFSPDGTYVLSVGVDLTGAVGVRKPEESPIYTLPVAGGRQQQLDVDSYVFSAGWGPHDSLMAYTTFDQSNPDREGLYITGTPGTKGELVLPGRFIAPTQRVRAPFVWASNNTILLSQAPEFKLVVVQLSQS